MSSLQITAQQQCGNLTSLSHFRSASTFRGAGSRQIFSPPKAASTFRVGEALPNICLNWSLYHSGCHKRSPVCKFSGEGRSQSGDQQGSPFKVFEKGLGLFKKDSVEEVLRKQIEKQEYFDDGGNGGSGLGGGGGGGGGGGSGGPEDGNVWDEVVQVVFGTIGFIFLVLSLSLSLSLPGLKRKASIHFFKRT
ncbi:OLC1v1014564C1 [Oldenlandia corymbosa var. corymbosa]|uniref:OLC1v1014564C1 n=1 Tax=Oldenlandia corymbosa var. corymbosa TaxID=529605 RepID=A0AAV1E0Z8_OLDCO|nr:OLC1v1014564C1 [Oldenlandia corymbosa var. corymbosa]